MPSGRESNIVWLPSCVPGWSCPLKNSTFVHPGIATPVLKEQPVPQPPSGRPPVGKVSKEGLVTVMTPAKPLATKNTTTHNATFVVRACKSVIGHFLCVNKPIYCVDGSLSTKRLNVSVDDENRRLCGGVGCLTEKIASAGRVTPKYSLAFPYGKS